VAGPVLEANQIDTARSSNALNESATGSLTASWPAGTDTDGEPPKVTGRMVRGTTAAPASRRPTVTRSNVTDCVP